MKCPRCGKRVGFNVRGNICPKCGAWLLTRPPSEHMIGRMQSSEGKDEFLNDFPWIGGTPGKRAMRFTAVWVTALVILAGLILVAFITMQFVLAILLIFITAAVGILPTFFLIGSRI